MSEGERKCCTLQIEQLCHSKRDRDSFIFALSCPFVFCYVPWLFYYIQIMCTKATVGDWLIASWLCRRERQKGTHFLMKNRDGDRRWGRKNREFLSARVWLFVFSTVEMLFVFLCHFCDLLDIKFFNELSFLTLVLHVNSFNQFGVICKKITSLLLNSISGNNIS